MDKQTTLGFVLIGLVLLVWMWTQAPPPPQPRPAMDSVGRVEHQKTEPVQEAPKEPEETTTSGTGPETFGIHFTHLATGDAKVLILETDLYLAEITTKGGLIRKWELKNYTTWDQHPVHLVDYEQGGDFSLLFTSRDGKLVNTRNLYFEAPYRDWEKVVLTGDESFSVDLVLAIADGKRIVKRFTFTNGKYSFEAEIRFENVETAISNFEYQVLWETGVRYAEHNSIDESSFAMAYALSGGELIEVDASSAGEVAKRDINGTTSWVATRSKYFAVAMLPEEDKSQGAYLEGVHLPQQDQGVLENYAIALKMPLNASTETARLTVFLGPLDIDIVRSYNRGLDQIMSLGAAWIIRPISEYILIPLIQLLHLVIPNYGFVIIVFSIIIKIGLHPLTKSSMKSMKRMQALQPLMTEIREKYKDDPQKMNHAVMNLYKEYGVNPAAGCLPLLLQMPILFALYTVFRGSIELRQAEFIWWINDLSIPDIIATLPFTIPMFQITHISGLALLMGITMFIQQKMTVTDPRQKAMVWMMPVLMTLLFNSFPAGLNLYYFVFNLLSIGQQMWINKHHGNEPLRKVDPKKKSQGIMGRLTRDLPKLR